MTPSVCTLFVATEPMSFPNIGNLGLLLLAAALHHDGPPLHKNANMLTAAVHMVLQGQPIPP